MGKGGGRQKQKGELENSTQAESQAVCCPSLRYVIILDWHWWLHVKNILESNVLCRYSAQRKYKVQRENDTACEDRQKTNTWRNPSWSPARLGSSLAPCWHTKYLLILDKSNQIRMRGTQCQYATGESTRPQDRRWLLRLRFYMYFRGKHTGSWLSDANAVDTVHYVSLEFSLVLYLLEFSSFVSFDFSLLTLSLTLSRREPEMN